LLLEGKKILILGAANHRSIAWAVATACDRAGAEICLTYQSEKLKPKIEALGNELSRKPILIPCDVTDDDHVEALFKELNKHWNSLDGMVHSIAFADRKDLENGFSETSRAGFRLALDVSAYSFVILARHAATMMKHGGSMVCMSYLGGERVFTNYNIMGVAKSALEMSARYLASDLGKQGVRVNVVSPGPLRTLAAAGIPGFTKILDEVAQLAPLNRNVTAQEVAKTTVFLMSDMASGITAERIHVDCGYHAMGM